MMISSKSLSLLTDAFLQRKASGCDESEVKNAGLTLCILFIVVG